MQRKYVEKRFVVKRSPLRYKDWFSIYDKHREMYIIHDLTKEHPQYTHQNNAQKDCDRLNMESKAYDKVLFKYLTEEIRM